MNNKILVVDDDKEICMLVEKYLNLNNYEVVKAYDGEEALELFGKDKFDMVITDVMMPKLDGIQLCKIIREKADIPVLLLTAKSEDMDKVLGFKIGADDYITKPFSVYELSARVEAHLRRYNKMQNSQNTPKETVIDLGYLHIDFGKLLIVKEGKEIALTAKELEILRLLSEHPEQVFSKKQIFKSVWKEDYFDDNTVTVHIRRLRKKIEKNPDEPQLIKTVWGLGYKFTLNEAGVNE